jgi:hypothetical protein
MIKSIDEQANYGKWQLILQRDFPFMRQDPEDDNSIYKKMGFWMFWRVVSVT